MVKFFQSVRGMHDCLPEDILFWQKIEYKLKQILTSYCFNEIRTPIVEQTALFSRAIGIATDVVEKEMYTFNDRDGNSLTLRPENTVGCVRAGIEHNMFYNHHQRFWYLGPMFRYERPQLGRYRQFHQLGAEVFGLAGPDIDAELIIMTLRWWKELGIDKYISLELNSIGLLASRVKYRQALVTYLQQHEHKLDTDCQRKLAINPLRILDSKNPDIQNLLNDAPLIGDYLDDYSKQHFIGLCELLDVVGVKYKINQRLIRGLDYYNCTVFEWITDELGAQNTICAGGRYDTLVEQFGGKSTLAVGLATGMERIVLLVRKLNPNFIDENTLVDVYLIFSSKSSQQLILLLGEKIRNKLPKLKLMFHYGGGSFKKQLSQADKYKAKFALILGENELKYNEIIIKNLRTGDQEKISQKNIIVRLMEILY